MPHPRISVIIPTLNEERYLPKLLDSLKRQEGWEWGRDFEVIVSDDGSADGTAGIARKYGAVFLEWDGSPTGPGMARNRGAKHAKAGVLLFLDADVVVDEGFLDEVARKTRVADMVVYSMKTNDSHIAYPFFLLSSLYFMLMTRLGMPITPGFCVAIRKEPFESVSGFPRHLRIGEDLFLGRSVKNLWFRIFHSTRLISVSSRRFKGGKKAVSAYRYLMNMLLYLFAGRLVSV